MTPTDSTTVTLDRRALADLATAVWRLRRRTDRDGGSLVRHVHAVADALTGAGVETADYDGSAFDPGMAVRVVAFQPEPHLMREMIVETVRPAVYLRDTLIGMAEVIVGTPADEDAERVTDERDS
jgi:hypothetical protein